MAAAHAAAFFPTRHAVSCISIQTADRQMTGSCFIPRLSFQSNVLSRSIKPAIKTHLWNSPITAMAQGTHVKKVTAKELDAILDSTRDCPVVVDFYATWCGPCILLSQELEQLAAEYGEAVKFLKVDTDEEYELASEMKIQGLPTLIFVSKDTEKNAIRTEGLLPRDVIRNIIETEL
eukprot:c22437_g1_i3 orf=128-658(+)